MRITPPSTEPVTTRPALLALLPADVAGRLDPGLLGLAHTAGAVRILATIRDPRVWAFVTAESIDWDKMLAAVRTPGIMSPSVQVRVEIAAAVDGYPVARADLYGAALSLDPSTWGAVLDAMSIAQCGLEEPKPPRPPMASTDAHTPHAWRVTVATLAGVTPQSALTASDADLEHIAERDPDHCVLTYHGELPRGEGRHLGTLHMESDFEFAGSFTVYSRLDAEDSPCSLCRQSREVFVAQFGGAR